MLCKTCEPIFKGYSYDIFKRKRHHRTPEQLEKAAKERCFVCDILWQRLLVERRKCGFDSSKSTMPPPSLVPSNSYLVPKHGHTREHPTLCEFFVWTLSDDDEYSPFLDDVYMNIQVNPTFETADGQMHLSSCSEILVVTLGFKHQKLTDDNSSFPQTWYLNLISIDTEPLPPFSMPQGRRTDSRTSLALISSWVRDCLEKHPKCKLADSKFPPGNPARLLDIGVSSRDKISLTPYPPNQRWRYNTLSHCWGAGDYLKLTTSTVDRLRSGISTTELAQTFQDAIFLTRHMGVRYLWIDCLCIFQDSKADWQQEASKMAGVYKGAMCNISADAAPDGHTGLFRDRDPQLLQPCLIVCAWDRGMNFNEYRIYQDNDWDSTMDVEPLASRGWILQETLLAPRVLHFTKRQVFWECYELRASEADPQGLPNILPDGLPYEEGGSQEYRDQRAKLAGIIPPNKSWVGSNKTPGVVPMNHALWASIVANYTKRALTKSSDKLIALSGIAKTMESIFSGNTYVCGMWRDNLIEQLLWRGRTQSGLRTTSYRAPSWSWTSVDGEVQLEEPGDPENDWAIARIDNIDMRYVTSDHTGEIASGSLRVSGPLFTAEMQYPAPLPKHLYWRDGSHLDWCDGALCTQQEIIFGEFPQVRLDIEPQRALSRLHCFPIRFHILNNYNGRIRGLLLEPTNLKKGQFRRLGLCEFMVKRPQKNNSRKTVAGSRSECSLEKDWQGWETMKNHDWMEYEESKGAGIYGFSII